MGTETKPSFQSLSTDFEFLGTKMARGVKQKGNFLISNDHHFFDLEKKLTFANMHVKANQAKCEYPTVRGALQLQSAGLSSL